MSLADAQYELARLLQTINDAKQYRYSAEISTNAKGEAQISIKVRGDDSSGVRAEIDSLTQEVMTIATRRGLRLPSK